MSFITLIQTLVFTIYSSSRKDFSLLVLCCTLPLLIFFIFSPPICFSVSVNKTLNFPSRLSAYSNIFKRVLLCAVLFSCPNYQSTSWTEGFVRKDLLFTFHSDLKCNRKRNQGENKIDEMMEK